MYLEGRGVRQSESKAAKWLQLAANQGEPEAQYHLGPPLPLPHSP